MKLDVWTDGGASGNPGPMKYGFVVFDGDERVHASSETNGFGTNNQAEMLAVLNAVKWLEKEMKPDHGVITMYTDSQLVYHWIRGDWRCNFDHIRELRQMIWRILKKIVEKYPASRVDWKAIPREINKAHAVGGW